MKKLLHTWYGKTIEFCGRNHTIKFSWLFGWCQITQARCAQKRKGELLVKDEFDEKFESLLVYGIITTLEYYKTKNYFLSNDFKL